MEITITYIYKNKTVASGWWIFFFLVHIESNERDVVVFSFVQSAL